MSGFLHGLLRFFGEVDSYVALFAAACVLSLVLTPFARAFARRLGMVDMPSARRINTTPIPRGGGLAIYVTCVLVIVLARLLFDFDPMAACACSPCQMNLLIAFSGLLALVGFLDDKFSLPPLVKLAGQAIAAAGAYFFCNVGFHQIFPAIPAFVDAPLTIFFLLGAINAFNLIDGLDGLATGLALIAALGIAGALICSGRPAAAFVYCIFIGACAGFLRYNFNPASVFLGDTGSMTLGYFLATTTLLLGDPSSFLVSIGVPLLAMGVPFFDMTLAVFRRTLRSLLFNEGDTEGGNRHLMQADTDHLHHRLLRQYVSQRKAAFVLYAFAGLLVMIGMGGVLLKGRAAALFIIGFMAVAVIIVRDMRRVELWDAARLLNTMAHTAARTSRRRWHRLSVLMYVAADLLVLFVAWVLVAVLFNQPFSAEAFRRSLPLHAVPIFLALAFFRTYRTVWSRALLLNYAGLFLAVVAGTAVMAVAVVMAQLPHAVMLVFSGFYAVLVLIGLIFVRALRPLVRDVFYLLTRSHLTAAADTSRVIVYGAGLRYRMFRRELVRAGAGAKRVVVGLLDDDILLRNHYVGNLRVEGTLAQAPEVIARLRADTVVIACDIRPEWFEVVRQTLAPTGVKVVLFKVSETALSNAPGWRIR